MRYFNALGCTRSIAAGLFVIGLSGCAQIASEQLSEGVMPPVMNPVTDLNQSLRDLPPPPKKVVVAVYDYTDQTGQFKPTEAAQTLSKAVTQGATSVLIKALQDAGNGGWFTVVEREKLDNLLKERRIIAQMRQVYLGEKGINPNALPPLLFAGILLEGGIIGFDSNLQTGGVGARLLGIGGDVKYRLNTITVYLRAVSTKTGEVFASVTTHKTIASIGLQGGVFKYIAVDKILEAEAGFTKNEPDQLAVQQAIEKAVYALIMEGADQNLWAFADKMQQVELVGAYREEQFSSAAGARAYSQAVKRNEEMLATASASAPQPISPQGNKQKAATKAVASRNTQKSPDNAREKLSKTGTIKKEPEPSSWSASVAAVESDKEVRR